MLYKSRRGHRQVMITHELTSWWKMDVNLLDHELSAMTTMTVFVAKDVALAAWKPKLCKGLVRKVQREWADERHEKK